MARIRTIKPEYFSDEKLGTLSIQSRYFYIGMWVHSDDFGVIRGDFRFLKSQIVPYDDSLNITTFTDFINELINTNLLIPFTYKNEKYLYIINFKTHQKVDRPSKPTIDLDTLSAILDEYSTNTRRILAPVSSNSKKEVVSSNGRECSRPSVSEVFIYFKEKKENEWPEKKCNVEAQKFVDYYESNGWRVGKNKMTSWRAAAAGWRNRDEQFSNQNQNQKNNQNGNNYERPKRAAQPGILTSQAEYGTRADL